MNEKQIVRDSRAGTGRYIYCGLRDVATELQQVIDGNEFRESDLPQSGDSVDRTILKSVYTLAEEWARACERASALNRSAVLSRVLDTLFVDSAFAGSPSGREIVSFRFGVPAETCFYRGALGRRSLPRSSQT